MRRKLDENYIYIKCSAFGHWSPVDCLPGCRHCDARDGWAVLGDELARRVPARRRGDRGIDVRDRRQRIHRAVRAVVGEEVSERGGRGD